MKITKKVEDRIKTSAVKFKKVLEAAKKCEKKPAEKKDDPPPAPDSEQQPSLTEQLLKEAEAQEQPPATPQNPSNEAE